MTTYGPGLLILAVAILTLFFAWRKLRLDRKNAELSLSSRNWPTTDGQIVEVGIQERRSSFRDTNNNNMEITQIRYEPQVDYAYEVAGQSYRGGRISFKTLDFMMEKSARQVIQDYVAGGTVAVAYDAGDPGNSVLDRSVKPSAVSLATLALFGVSLALVIFGAAMFFI